MSGEKVVTLLVEDEEVHAILTMRILERERMTMDAVGLAGVPARVSQVSAGAADTPPSQDLGVLRRELVTTLAVGL